MLCSLSRQTEVNDPKKVITEDLTREGIEEKHRGGMTAGDKVADKGYVSSHFQRSRQRNRTCAVE
jgi:hypothetical protein